jgi:3-deoxy-D-manno-octulosonic acid kinase
MLASLHQQGLPVPRPLAAQCAREGLFYSGDLITRRLLDVLPLADLPDIQQSDPAMWIETGACVRHFHDHGLVHADLNARNILISGDGSVYLIDFDRAQIRAGAQSLFEANLRRLKRSLQKFLEISTLEQGWQFFMNGYNTGPGEQAAPDPGESRNHHPGVSQ